MFKQLKLSRCHKGFTLIELIMVIVIIGVLGTVAMQKMLNMYEEAEIVAEDSTIEIMRKNVLGNFGDDLVKGIFAQYPTNPFTRLQKIPEGYARRRNTPPSGDEEDDNIWVFVQGQSGGQQITPEQAGTTLVNFVTTGFIFHQRRDHTIVKWAYDASTGTISNKIIVQKSEIKKQLQEEQVEQGAPTEDDRLLQSRRLGSGLSPDQAAPKRSNLNR